MAASDANPYGTAYWNEHGESVTENTRGANSRVIMDRAYHPSIKATQARQPFFSIIGFTRRTCRSSPGRSSGDVQESPKVCATLLRLHHRDG